jgi:hypothetical protein
MQNIPRTVTETLESNVLREHARLVNKKNPKNNNITYIICKHWHAWDIWLANVYMREIFIN